MNIKLTDKDKIRIDSAGDLYGIMQRILLRENKIDQEKEHFWIVGMNNIGVILYIELVSMGSFRSTSVEPMNVFRVAILKGASRVIAVHNHPSGSLTPSDNDKDCTNKLIQVGKIINITVVDHLIISTKTYTSFSSLHLMDELASSLKYVPTYQLIENIREEEKAIHKEALKVVEEKLEKQKEELMKYKIATINNLLASNIAISKIAVILNLEEKEVEEIIKTKEKE